MLHKKFFSLDEFNPKERMNMKNFLIIIFIFIAGCFERQDTHLYKHEESLPKKNVPQQLVPSELENATTKGVQFLYMHQLPYGEFRSYFCKDSKGNCFFDSSPFITAFVLYSIQFARNPSVKEMTDKAIQFLLNEKDDHEGIWSFWTSRNNNWDFEIPPDMDDTAMASYILKENHILVDNKVTMYKNRNDAGLFYTWFVHDRDNDNVNTGKIDNDNIDSVVNANVLLYLGENEQTRESISFLNNLILRDEETGSSTFYPDPLALYYVIGRAYRSGVTSLDKSKKPIIRKILKRQKPDGSFGNELLTGLAVCTLLDFNYEGLVLDKAIAILLTTQAENGSWKRAPFFTGIGGYWVSEDLTTAIAIEAIEKYRAIAFRNRNNE